MQDPLVIVAHNVKLTRVANSMTQDDLAERASMDPAEIRRIESGRRDPGTRVIARLAEGLGVPASALFEGVGKVARKR